MTIYGIRSPVLAFLLLGVMFYFAFYGVLLGFRQGVFIGCVILFGETLIRAFMGGFNTDGRGFTLYFTFPALIGAVKFFLGYNVVTALFA